MAYVLKVLFRTAPQTSSQNRFTKKFKVFEYSFRYSRNFTFFFFLMQSTRCTCLPEKLGAELENTAEPRQALKKTKSFFFDKKETTSMYTEKAQTGAKEKQKCVYRQVVS